MRKLIMMAALCSCITTLAIAQEEVKPKPDVKQHAERQTDMMGRNLNLTEEQKAKVAEINMAAAKEIREKGSNNKEQRMAAMAKRNERLKTILTADQLGKYEEMQARRAQIIKQRQEGVHK